MGQFFYGVIEGFYGRTWTWSQRESYADFLKSYGFDCYIYAPKSDAALRTQWREPFPEPTAVALERLGAAYRNQGLRWGIGLSPLGLSERFTPQDQRQLLAKVAAINKLQPDILCILFDDMRGDIPHLAERQLSVIDAILTHSTAAQHIFCPTYYSFDPVLEKVFGAMPADYWQSLNAGLPETVDFFWTGNEVISPAISAEDVERATEALGRRPLLWDNYPVNDGKKTASHLHLRPYRDRSPNLQQLTAGHVVNPMNQAQLSQLVLQSLQCVYQPQLCSADDAWQRGLALLGNEALAAQLAAHVDLFQDGGLEAISAADRAELVTRYARFNHPAAREVVDWLRGEYQFDPACLTD